MANLSKSQAQSRADQVQAFRAEQEFLKNQGLLQLPESTANTIRQYHDELLDELQQSQDVDLSDGAKSLSLGMQIVSFLGASALAASLFFLFYQYWGYFSTASQVAVLVSAPLLSLALALWVRRLDSSGYYAKLAALVSFSSWVLNIVMLGSIFNMTPSPNALAVFALYGFLLAYLLQVRLLLAAAMFCSFIFIGAQFGTWMGSYWVYVGEFPEHIFLPAFLFFIVPILINQDRFHGFSSIYQILSTIAFFIALLILANWGRASYLPWSNSAIEGSYQLLGFVASALLVIYGIRTNATKLMLTGNVFFALFLYTKFFDWWWGWLPKYVFFLLIGLTAILAMVVFNRLRKLQQQGGRYEN
ncbi:DUF2157 domain-containing protein [Gilvimarinus polysaccharolyticus]|uniref:DUF2157 domain-containing protein n=1 Tax=Gilvimarinus polysaccharolyticus TaxID=863921 RepID=UPI0006731A77|nr:DUF2157 domain-containing protein [Gilvimarinus polysaccharolyticus]